MTTTTKSPYRDHDSLDLFEQPSPYPQGPGASTDVTSIEAADTIAPTVHHLQQRILDHLRRHGGRTVHETADELGIPISTIQPRFSELRQLEQIEDSGDRRHNWRSKRRAIVWRIASG